MAMLTWGAFAEQAPELAEAGRALLYQFGPGLAYHTPSGKLVAWAGGPDVYVLDLATMAWTRVPGVGSVNPGPAASRGTFGRFRYIESRDLFIVVNDVDLDVFVYRLP